MVLSPEISVYNEGLSADEQLIANELCRAFDKNLPGAEAKVWHGHPVWFIEGNPIVGYSLKKSGIEVLFWSGQSFKSSGLKPLGKFKAASLAVATIDELHASFLNSCLKEAKSIQWDYKNLPKKRQLEKLTDF